MQKLFIVLMFAFILSSCADKGNSASGEKSPGDTSYLLTGNIQGLDSGWAYLYHAEKNEEIPDSAKIVNGSFEFKGYAAHPEFTLLGYDQNGQKKFPLGFFLESGKITIKDLWIR